MSTMIDERLVGEAMAAYVEWLQLSVAVQDAYDRWRRGPRSDAANAFLDYRIALDEEERGSLAYACLITGVL